MSEADYVRLPPDPDEGADAALTNHHASARPTSHSRRAQVTPSTPAAQTPSLRPSATATASQDSSASSAASDSPGRSPTEPLIDASAAQSFAERPPTARRSSLRLPGSASPLVMRPPAAAGSVQPFHPTQVNANALIALHTGPISPPPRSSLATFLQHAIPVTSPPLTPSFTSSPSSSSASSSSPSFSSSTSPPPESPPVRLGDPRRPREWSLRNLNIFQGAREDEAKDGDEAKGDEEGTHATSAFLARLLAVRKRFQRDDGTAHVNPDFASVALSPLAAAAPAAETPHLRFLTFTDAATEAAYNADYFTRYFSTLRQTVLICVAIWSLFAINDIFQKVTRDARKNFAATMGLRFLVAAVVALSALSSYHPKVRELVSTTVLRWTIFYYILLFGTCQVAFGVIEMDTPDPTYCDFIILISSMSASFFRLPFFMSTACNLLLCLVFVFLSFATRAWQASAPVSTDQDGILEFLAATVWIFIALWLFTFNGYLVEHSMRSTFLAAQQLSQEEEKSQRVLATMLPVRVIHELRGTSAFVYEHHRSISVLFSHIHDFDAHTALLEAKAVVELLNALFSRFDHLTDMFGVYKVETIGDVYLVSGGVPDALESHACIVALLALAMMEEMTVQSKHLKAGMGGKQLPLRVGIHSGSVIAGVVGMKYPRYRLMGDTVNTASRMSTTCNANQVQLSRATFQQLTPDFVCTYNGKRPIKGKGEMDTYLLRYVLPTDGQSLPLGIEEAIGYKTGEQVAADLGLPVPLTQPPLHIRTASLPTLALPPNGSPPIRGRERRSSHNPSVPATPTNARGSSQPGSRRASVEPSLIPRYHAEPIPGCLYSNTTLSPSTVTFDADDVAAISAAIAQGRSVHVLRRVTESSASGDPDGEEKTPLTSPAHERFVAGMRIVEEERKDRKGSERSDDHTDDEDAAPHPAPTIITEDVDYPLRSSSEPLLTSGAEPGTAVTPTSPPSSSYTRVVGAFDAVDSSAAPSSALLTLSIPPAAPLSPSTSQTDLSPALASPSTIYTLSAEQVRSTFLSHTQPSFLRRFQRQPPGAEVPARVRLSEILHQPRQYGRMLRDKAWALVNLQFAGDAALEKRFQAHWVDKSLTVSRIGFTGFFVGLGLLGLSDAFGVAHRNDVVDTWEYRTSAMGIGLLVVSVSYLYPRWFRDWHQLIVAVSWAVMTMLQILVSAALHENTAVYGVSGTLILLTSTSFFVGLQFKWVSFTTLSILLFYVVTGIVTSASTPDRGKCTDDDPPDCSGAAGPGGTSTILNSFFLLAAVGLSMMSAHSSEWFTRLDFIRYLTLKEEESKTREIRDNMLPKEVMGDIMRQQTAPGAGPIIAHECPQASVLFCDIVSFTALAAVISAEDVVAILNVMFSTFDALTTKHGVYKVETIGDAYLACSGVVDRRDGHIDSLVRCALDFQASSHYFHSPNGKPLKVRIGIHTGNVVAGVVGRKMPRYHLFGATVTIAEEMEQSGVAGGVVISGETHRHLGPDLFACRPLTDLPHVPEPVPRWEVQYYRGPFVEEKAAPVEEEGNEKAVPPVVSQILEKVAEGNLREHQERERKGASGEALSATRSDREHPSLRLAPSQPNGARAHEGRGGRLSALPLPEEKTPGNNRRRSNSDSTAVSGSPMNGASSSTHRTPLLSAVAAEPSSPSPASLPSPSSALAYEPPQLPPPPPAAALPRVGPAAPVVPAIPAAAAAGLDKPEAQVDLAAGGRRLRLVV